jgi:hypothetical protein
MHFQVCSAVRAEEVRRAGGKKKKEEIIRGQNALSGLLGCAG